MSLLEQRAWWLGPYVLLMLFMVHAMVEFTLGLLIERPYANRKPLPAKDLKQRLLDHNLPDRPYRLVEGEEGELELQWDVVDAAWGRQFASIKLTTYYRARLLLDEVRHEVRIQEFMRTSSFFLGFDGWIPRLHFYVSAHWGPMNVNWAGQAYGILPGFPPQIGEVVSFTLNTAEVKQEIGKTVRKGGWTFRPVIWTSQVRRSRLRTLTPAPLRRIPHGLFWGVLYPASYALGIGYLLAIIGRPGWTAHNLLIIAGISVIWWGMWGFLTWAIAGFPSSGRRRTRRKAK
jgi:hypothetical protein